MERQQAGAIEVVALLAPGLLHGRTKLGKHVQELVLQRPEIREYRSEDGTLRCPRVCISAQEAPPLPGMEQLKTITWRVGLETTPHLMLCFTPQEFVREADNDGLASLLHRAERAAPGCRLHLLTYAADSSCQPLWQLAAHLAVWRPDVALYHPTSLGEAAECVYRVTRAVAETAYKQTGMHSFLSAQLLPAAMQGKRERLDRLLGRAERAVQYHGNEATLMRGLLALPGVSAEAAYAVARQYGSLQGLVEAAERDGAASTQAAVGGLPLPASTVVVGQAAAQRILRLAAG